MSSADEDAARLWARSDLLRLAATVTRVSATFVSLALPPPRGLQSIPWPGPAKLAVGDRVTVAGDQHRGAFRVLVVEVRRLWRTTLVAIPRPSFAPPPPTSPQPWLDVLVRHGLLATKSAITRESWVCDPVGVLLSVHAPRGALERGFVHYDHRWGNDTDDLIADLATIAKCPASFRQLGVWTGRDADEMTFEVLHPDGSVVRDCVEGFEGDICDVADHMNRWLEELGVERRIWCSDTGRDSFAFLGRSQAELDAMRADGLPMNALMGVPEAGLPDPHASDWSDVL